MSLRHIIRPLAAACAAALVLQACSVSQVVTVATSRNPGEAARALAQNRAVAYQQNPLLLAKDLEQARVNFDRLVSALRGEAGKSWGQKEAVVPSNKNYVKYTQNYQSRAMVQFETGRITVETLDQKNPDTSLRNAIVTTLLTPDDPRAVDLYSSKNVELSGRPYLYGLVADEKGKSIENPAQAESFAAWLVRERKETRTVHTEQGDKQAAVVHFQMVSDYSNRQAQRYAAEVDRQAKRFGVSRSLIFAVIKTESAFNPYAVSSAPAYGLMQLVPGTGGRDAYKYAKGTDYTPTKEYLFQAANNIELGTAYLNLIDSQYLGQIADPVTREYCTIAAYNGGAGNVLNLFSKDRAQAPNVINSLPASKVYLKLRDEHPREETRRYLVKVLDARKEFSGGAGT
jgi:membrane-bound lytic murein transglycosylase C